MFLGLRGHLHDGSRKRGGSMHGRVRGVPEPINASILGCKMSKRQILFQWYVTALVEACVFTALAVSGLLARMSATDIMIAAYLPVNVPCLYGAICRLREPKAASASCGNARRRQIILRVLFAVLAVSVFLVVAISGVLDRLPTVPLLTVGFASPVIIELVQSAYDIRSEIKRGRD